MKFLYTSILLIVTSLPKTFAQSGEAIKFDYDNAGNRIKRYFVLSSPLKPGRNDTANIAPVDTITGQFKQGVQDLIISAYPNPVTTALIVENRTWQPSDRAELKLYDITGKLLQAKSFAQAKDLLYFGDIAGGMYTVYYYLNGKMITYWKVMKNNTK